MKNKQDLRFTSAEVGGGGNAVYSTVFIVFFVFSPTHLFSSGSQTDDC